MLRQQQTRPAKRRGHAVVELSLLMPWIYFLFVGALDFGFYSYALISVENAARIAALSGGSSVTVSASQADACYHVQRELAKMPNASSFPFGCDAAPLLVTVTPYTDSEGMPATRIQVNYDTVTLIPIPGLVPGKVTISRTVHMRVYGD